MTEENRPRPNAKYKLSKPDGVKAAEEEKLTFYYNRERRLAKAPKVVKDLYKTPKYSGFNLLRPLIADKPRATLFFTILLMSGVILLISVLGYFNRSYTLGGNKLELSGTRFEGATIVILRKTLKNSAAYSGAVDIAASAAVGEGEEPPVFYHRVFFTLAPEEEYRFVVPFDAPQLLMVLQAEKDSVQVKLNTE